MSPFLLLALILTGCASLALGKPAPQPTFTPLPLPGTGTPCGCTLNETPIATQPGGLSAVGPQVPAETTPVDLQSLKGQWKPYAAAGYPFSFEYPAAYDVDPYAFCAARQTDAPDPAAGALYHLSLGSRTELTLLPAAGKSLDALAEDYKTALLGRDPQASFDAPQSRQIGGQPALTLGYHSGGAGRYGEATLFLKDEVLYRVETGVPSACDVAELSLTELNAYTHLLDTFTFTP